MAVNTPHFSPSSGLSKVSSTDTTADYLINKIVEGANITITKNNSGGDETLTISSTGGSATFSSETPSGTINGTNTVFTLNNIPKFLFLNGQYQTVTTDYAVTGSGPYTLTYTQAPAGGNHISLY